jgi:hypothetical protein
LIDLKKLISDFHPPCTVWIDDVKIAILKKYLEGVIVTFVKDGHDTKIDKWGWMLSFRHFSNLLFAKLTIERIAMPGLSAGALFARRLPSSLLGVRFAYTDDTDRGRRSQ